MKHKIKGPVDFDEKDFKMSGLDTQIVWHCSHMAKSDVDASSKIRMNNAGGYGAGRAAGGGLQAALYFPGSGRWPEWRRSGIRLWLW